jgi:hypothetical protein
MADVPLKPSSRVSEFLRKHTASARLIFVVDATGSRQPTWDMAAGLQNAMFEEVTKLGKLEIQLIYYRGPNEVSRSPWMISGSALANLMSKVTCRTGLTQIRRALNVAREEHQRQKVAAVVFIGDAMEENSDELCRTAAELGAPLFIFQEGDDPTASETFSQMARLSGGAHCRFDAGAAKQLAELLRAIAAFAVGGVKALQDLKTDSARKLLGQVKRDG